MLCSGCGKDIEEGRRFCKYCGADVDVTAVAPATVDSVAPAALPSEPPPPWALPPEPTSLGTGSPSAPPEAPEGAEAPTQVMSSQPDTPGYGPPPYWEETGVYGGPGVAGASGPAGSGNEPPPPPPPDWGAPPSTGYPAPSGYPPPLPRSRPPWIVIAIIAFVLIAGGAAAAVYFLTRDDNKGSTTTASFSTTTSSATSNTVPSSTTLSMLPPTSTSGSTTTIPSGGDEYLSALGGLDSVLLYADQRIPELADRINSTAPNVPPVVRNELQSLFDDVRAALDNLNTYEVVSGYEEADSWLQDAAISMEYRIESTILGIEAMWDTGSVSSGRPHFDDGRRARDDFHDAYDRFVNALPGD